MTAEMFDEGGRKKELPSLSRADRGGSLLAEPDPGAGWFLPTAWDLAPEQAAATQSALRPRVRLSPLACRPRWIGGADVAYLESEEACVAAVVVLDGCTGPVVDQAVVLHPVAYPYVPGLFAFREIPPLLHAFWRLRTRPDLLFVDGHGVLHPRGVGLATHLGVLLEIPTIGCAKGPPAGAKKGDAALFRKRAASPFSARGTAWLLAMTPNNGPAPQGALLCTKDRCKPIFVSPGHLITLAESMDWSLRAASRYRIPEPIRRAHHLAQSSKVNKGA